MEANVRTSWSHEPKPGQVERVRGRKGVKLRQRIKQEEPLCRECLARGHVSPAEHVDHIVPLAQGGTNERGGLSKVCGRRLDTCGRPGKIINCQNFEETEPNGHTRPPLFR
ncbi:HNH endonuclease [Faunimonas sp. B44]|uniref:HNH endonuclease n=1 Tax=Faunimonas sp. B44 TaxID=3461493 RepID=UPI0040441175